MKKEVKKKALRAVAVAVKAGMKRQSETTSICPVFFHQPKRPQK